jgi:hypothetical protein
VDIIDEQPHPLQHHAVVDEVTSELETTGCEFWSPKEPNEFTDHETIIGSSSRSCSDSRDSSKSQSLSCKPSTTTWQDKLVIANHSNQAKEVSIKDRPPDLSFVEQLSRQALRRINSMFSDNNPERDKYLLSLMQMSL